MTDKEILYQMINREISNLLAGFNPGLRGFSNVVTNYVIKYIDPYVDAFMNGDKLNIPAVNQYLKDETSRKIDEYMNRFKSEASKNDEL